jgi:hypothetical protein
MAKSKSTPKNPAQIETARVQKEKVNRARFLNVAVKRTKNSLKALENLMRCSNKQSYSYTTEEAVKIVNAIKNATANLDAAFSTQTKKDQGFEL